MALTLCDDHAWAGTGVCPKCAQAFPDDWAQGGPAPTHDRVSPWVPITDLRTLKAMGKATEELGECTSAIARCLIQGLDATEPDTGKVNRDWLEEEIADARAMLDELEQDLNLDGPRMAARTARKRAAQRRWKDML